MQNRCDWCYELQAGLVQEAYDSQVSSSCRVRMQRFQKLQRRDEELKGLDRGPPLGTVSGTKPPTDDDRKSQSQALTTEGRTAAAVSLAHSGSKATARVHFTLRFKTDWGQRLCLTGSQEGLGTWSWRMENCGELTRSI